MERVDLQSLPQTKDAWTFLYLERGRLERDATGLVLMDEKGTTSLPVAALSVIMLGPGTTVTHAAVTLLADSGCSVVWCGEGGVRLYAAGLGETRRSANLEQQARMWANEENRLEVALRMYRMRFQEELDPGLRIEQLRGMEGVRVREAYARASERTGVAWHGRSYRSDDWQAATPVNRALSAANSCLYGLCHAAIVATGFTPGLGFVHTGKLLSFVYDIADLYKVDVTVPIAFRVAAEVQGSAGIETAARRACRDAFKEFRLLERIVPDIQRVVGLRPETARLIVESDFFPTKLWDPEAGEISGGENYAKLEGRDGSEREAAGVAAVPAPAPGESPKQGGGVK